MLKPKEKIDSLSSNISVNSNSIIDSKIESKIKKIIDYYLGLYKLVYIYLEELIKYLENKEKKEDIKKILLVDTIQTNIKKIQNILNNKINDKLMLIYIYDILITIQNNINELISQIKIINIYDEITLLSDTSKNNINQNKIVILDMHSKIKNKNNKILNKIVNHILNNYIITYDSYLILHNYYIKNPNIIILYTNVIKNYLNLSIEKNSKLTSLIIYNNQLDKNKLLTDYIKNLKYLKSINNNDFNDFNYLFKPPKIIKNKNLVGKFNNFTSYKKFSSIHNLFLDIHNANFQFKTNDINNKTITIIQKIVDDYYKIERQYLNITIIELPIEKFNYNCFTLLNSKFQLEKNIGINNKYINKTKTIITENEYKTLEEKDTDYKNDLYLSYFDKFINVNNFKHKLLKSNNLDILLESHYMLIIKLIIDKNNNEFHIMEHNKNNSNENNIYMSFNNIRELLQNKSNYFIENYNLIRNNKIIKNINNENILNSYLNKIAIDYKNVPIIDNLKLKNIILNKIKITIKQINQKTKDTNIEKIINIIIDELYKYIQITNNINFSPEIYLTYYSNINNLMNKIKKELNDNYNEDLLNNIDNILNNIYSKIITINNNILDKYYLTQL